MGRDEWEKFEFGKIIKRKKLKYSCFVRKVSNAWNHVWRRKTKTKNRKRRFIFLIKRIGFEFWKCLTSFLARNKRLGNFD